MPAKKKFEFLNLSYCCKKVYTKTYYTSKKATTK